MDSSLLTNETFHRDSNKKHCETEVDLHFSCRRTQAINPRLPWRATPRRIPGLSLFLLIPLAVKLLPHHALVFFVPHLNPLLPLVLVEFVLVQDSKITEIRLSQLMHRDRCGTWSGKCVTKAVVFTSEGAAVHWTGSLVSGHPCCNHRTLLARRRRPGGPLSLEDNRCHRLRWPPSLAGRTASVWHPGSAPLTRPRGRTWHGT